MRVHYIQHVPFEDLGMIRDWADEKGHVVTVSRVFEEASFPASDDFDWLFVMGGPMNIYEEERYPWMRAEKEFIRTAIKENKQVIGICLGAQLIADVCGAKVRKNEYAEIGWFPVAIEPSVEHPAWVRALAAEFQAFHWHGDTFELPPDAVLFLASEACPRQGFYMNGGKVIGLQCHFELQAEGIRALVENCYEDESPGPFVQTKEEILKKNHYCYPAQAQLATILDRCAFLGNEDI
jgi:GMP synthase (glutamine-hydrolysing)